MSESTPLLDWQPTYPCNPGAKARETSFRAADEVASAAKLLRERVYGMFCAGLHLTADECAQRLDKSILSVRPRLSELCARNLIQDSGIRRRNASGKNAIVWKKT